MNKVSAVSPLLKFDDILQRDKKMRHWYHLI